MQDRNPALWGSGFLGGLAAVLSLDCTSCRSNALVRQEFYPLVGSSSRDAHARLSNPANILTPNPLRPRVWRQLSSYKRCVTRSRCLGVCDAETHQSDGRRRIRI